MKEILKYKLYDNIEDLPTITFWYQHFDMIWNHRLIQMFAHYCLLCSYVTSLLSRVTKSQKVYILSHQVIMYGKNVLRCIAILLDIGPKVSQRRSPETGIITCPHYLSLRTMKNNFPELLQPIHRAKWGKGWKLGFPCQDTLWKFLF